MSKVLERAEVEAFDWNKVEAEHNALVRKHNSRIQTTNPAEVVYCHETYAQELYDLYNGIKTEYKTPVKGEIIAAKVLSKSNTRVMLDVSYREDVFLDLSKESKKYVEMLEIGEEVKVKVLNDKEESNIVNVSFTAAVLAYKEDEIRNSIEESVAYEATVEELVSGGYIVSIDDVKAFLPGSLAGVNKLHDFDVLLGETVYVMPVNWDVTRQSLIVSRRKYLHTLIPSAIDNIKEKPSDHLIEGFVTGTTEYGVFCEFNDCLTGMIHVTDLVDELKKSHKERNIKPGDKISFYIKEIVNNKKIILTQIQRIDPWDNIEERYNLPCDVSAKVTSVKDYGAFVQIEEGIVGLLHHSEYKDKDIKEGDIVNVQITRFENNTKKVFLSMTSNA